MGILGLPPRAQCQIENCLGMVENLVDRLNLWLTIEMKVVFNLEMLFSIFRKSRDKVHQNNSFLTNQPTTSGVKLLRLTTKCLQLSRKSFDCQMVNGFVERQIKLSNVKSKCIIDQQILWFTNTSYKVDLKMVVVM